MTGDYDVKLTAWLDDHTEDLIALACDLIRIPSVTGSEGELARFLGDWLSKNGIAYEFSVIPEAFRDTYPDFAEEQNLGARPNLYARLKGSGSGQEPPVVLNGHLDVVPVGDVTRWRFDPFSAARSEGAIWGRGAADMKGPIAAGLMALLAVKECGLSLARDIEFHLVICEEGGGLGTLFALSERPKAAATIVLEPTCSRIVTAGAGALQFTVRAVGKAAHSCAPWEGRSALAILRHCLTRLEGYAARRNASLAHPLFTGFPEHVPLAIGTFSAGEWRGIVPESGYFSGRIGLLPGEEIPEIRSQLEDEVAHCRDELQVGPQDLTIDWPNVGFPAWETVENSVLIDAMQAAAGKLGQCADPTGVVFGADAGFVARNGIPVAMYGPGDITVAHMVDEHVLEREVAEAGKTLALTLARLTTQNG